jgi:hypothetical protein
MSIWVIAPPVSLPNERDVRQAEPVEELADQPGHAGQRPVRARLHDPPVRARRQGWCHAPVPGRPAGDHVLPQAGVQLAPGAEPASAARRPLPFAGRVRLLLHDIPAPPTRD